MTEYRILFVCLGNICRSPMAEGVFRHVSGSGELAAFSIDSAGTAGWHEGSPPDSRAQAALMARGIDISQLRARQVSPRDFERNDLLLAMDDSNLQDLSAIAPHGAGGKVHLFLDYALGETGQEVPDPYYGGTRGFDEVFDLVERASLGLMRKLSAKA